jgi:hypothetical protein
MIDPILRGQDWDRIWNEDEGLKFAFERIRETYFERAGLVEPWEGDKLAKLALAGRILDMVKAHVQSVIAAGTIAAHTQDKADQIAKLPEHKRRWLQR